MTDLALRAHFPLGVFQGRRQDGSTRDPWPDVARLHGALLHAASKGTEAEVRGGDLRPTQTSLEALEWLETHPPTSVSIPEHFSIHREPIIGYRNEGLVDNKDKKLRIRVAPAGMNCRTALASDMGWRWEDVPDAHAATITRLCADVSCLGEVDSPVVLETGDTTPTHGLDESATQLSPGKALPIRCPARGRTAALEKLYESEHPKKRRLDSSSQKESSTVSPDAGHTKALHYSALSRQVDQRVPWPRVWLFTGAGSIPWTENLAWCVGFHRMLAARAGDGAPPIITGSYPKGLARPANRLAIQAIDASIAPHWGIQGTAFALLLPEEMTARETALLHSITAGTLTLRVHGHSVRIRRACEIQGDEFWELPAAGLTRLWTTSPAMVSEVRRQPPRGGKNWTLREAALLAVAFVMRESLGIDGAVPRRYWDRVESVRARGVDVLSANRIMDSRVDRYAYKLPRDVVAQPFSATLSMGELLPPTALAAVGQSRHVGGGLLIPVDVPDHVAGDRR